MGGSLTRRRAPLAALAVAAVLALSACFPAPPPRAPHPGELIGTWKSGAATLIMSDGTFLAVGIPASDIDGATATGRVSFTGTWTTSKEPYAGYPQIILWISRGTDLGVGDVQAVFDSTTNPVSIAITYGGPEVPQFLHLS